MALIFATEFEILRQVPVSGRSKTPLGRKPVRVGTIINEDLFLRSGGAMVHNKTVFFEDYVHDWNWAKGQFSYYTRVAGDNADVVIAYETEKRDITLEEAIKVHAEKLGTNIVDVPKP